MTEIDMLDSDYVLIGFFNALKIADGKL